MTMDEWKSVAKILNAMYDDGGRYMFEASDREKMQTWFSCLEDLDYKIVCKAVKNVAMKIPYKPKIYDIRNEYMLITSAPTPREQEAWDMVRDGIRNGTYGAVDEFNKFPDVIKKAVGSPMSLTEWAALESSEVETVIQSQFLRAYRAEVERQSQANVLGAIGAQAGSMVQIAENVAKRLKDKGCE